MEVECLILIFGNQMPASSHSFFCPLHYLFLVVSNGFANATKQFSYSLRSLPISCLFAHFILLPQIHADKIF